MCAPRIPDCSTHFTRENCAQKLLHAACAVIVQVVVPVVELAIVDHQKEVSKKHVTRLIPAPPPDTLLDSAQVDGLLYHVGVVLDLVRVHGLAEGPRELLFLRLAVQCQQIGLELVRLAVPVLVPSRRRLQVGHGPASLGYAGEGHGAGRSQVLARKPLQIRLPACGERRVNDSVRLRDRCNALKEELLLGGNHLLHPSEVDRGVDVALHERAAVVVLDETVVPPLGHGEILIGGSMMKKRRISAALGMIRDFRAEMNRGMQPRKAR